MVGYLSNVVDNVYVVINGVGVFSCRCARIIRVAAIRAYSMAHVPLGSVTCSCLVVVSWIWAKELF